MDDIGQAKSSSTKIYAGRPGVPLFACAGASLLLSASDCGVYLAVPGAVIIISICLILYRQNRTILIWLLPLVYIISCSQMLLIFLSGADLKKNLDRGEFLLRGRIITLPDPGQRDSQVIVRLENQARVYLTAPADSLSIDSVIEVPVKLSLPSGANNPGGFSQKDWLKSQGVLVIAEPLYDVKVREIAPAPKFNLAVWAAGQKLMIRNFLNKVAGSKYSGVITSLLLGDKTGLQPEESEYIRRAGISHLAAASGTHLAMLVLPLESILTLLHLRRKLRLIVLALLIVMYCLTAGWPISLVRASLMYLLVICGRLLNRQTDPLNLLSCAALIILIFNPLAALSPGFWMSVLATGSIMLWSGPMSRFLSFWLPVIPRWLLWPFCAGVCAQFAVLPFVADLGGEVSITGLAGTLLLTPVLQVILALCILYLPLLMLIEKLLLISSGNLYIIAAPLRLAAEVFLEQARFLALMDFGRWQAGSINLAIWCWLYSWPAGWCGIARKTAEILHVNYGRVSRVFSALRIIAACAGLAVVLMLPLLRPPFQIWFFDVGQGDAILMRTRSGRTILVDGGRSGSGFKVIMPTLDFLGINKIDLAIATHFHDDHLGGIIDLLRMKRIGRLAIPAGADIVACDGDDPDCHPPGDHSGAELLLYDALALAGSSKTGVQIWQANDTILLDQNTQLKVLYPGAQINPDQIGDDNNLLSMVIMVETCGRRILLTGDCLARTESELMDSGTLLDADLLKVAHHGSGLSSTGRFLNEVNPQLAVISVGKNVYGHPDPRVLQSLADLECQARRTDYSGAVTWCVWPDRWMFKSMHKPEIIN